MLFTFLGIHLKCVFQIVFGVLGVNGLVATCAQHNEIGPGFATILLPLLVEIALTIHL